MSEDKKKLDALAKKVRQAKSKGTDKGAPSPTKLSPPPDYPYPVLEDLYRMTKERLPPWERVIVDWDDEEQEISITIEVKEGFEHRRVDKSPLTKTLKFPTTVTLVSGIKVPVKWIDIQLYPVLDEKIVAETIRDVIIKETVNEIIDKYYLTYIHPAFIFSPMYLIYRFEGDKKAYVVVANLAKEGSPWHASVLYTKIVNRLRMWADTKSDVEHFVAVDGLKEWGFPNLQRFLASFPTYNYFGGTVDLQVVVDWLAEGVKEVLSKYARVVDSPDMLTEEDVKKTYEVADRVAKTMPVRLLRAPPVFDEGPIIEILAQLAVRYPELKPKVMPIVQARSEYEKALETKVEKAEEIAHEIVEALKETGALKKAKRPSDIELIEDIKTRILKRLEEL